MAEELKWPAHKCPQKLGLDEACFKVFSKVDFDVELYANLDVCYKSLCACLPWKHLSARDNVSLLVDSSYPLHFYYTHSGQQICHETFRFSEHSTYTWNVTDDLCTHVDPKSHFDVFYWLPVFLATLALIVSSGLWVGAQRVYRSSWMSSFRSQNTPYANIENDLNIPPESNVGDAATAAISHPRRQGTRIHSLDTLRGICIALMIFVNYGGGHYKIFKHSPWNGLTFADLVFPWFLWVMGVSLVLSLRSQFRNDRSRVSVWLLVTRRSAILILLGLILNSVGREHNSLANYRIPGVLQRIGLAYFIISSFETCFMNPGGPLQSRLCEDLIYGWIQSLVASLLALTWAVLTLLLEVPGCPTGYLGPGGLTDRGSYVNCTGGAAGYIDRVVFTPDHLYQIPTCEKVYKCTQPFDPEGLLGTLTAALLVHMGAHAGRILLCFSSLRGRIIRWFVWGVVCCVCAGALCQFTADRGWIPINKNLFSLSYVLLTGGLAFILLAVLYFLIDHQEIWNGAPFKYAGMNAILLYICHEVVRGMFPWSWKPIWNTHAELLVMNIWGASLWIFIAYLLWRRELFLSI